MSVLVIEQAFSNPFTSPPTQLGLGLGQKPTYLPIYVDKIEVSARAITTITDFSGNPGDLEATRMGAYVRKKPVTVGAGVGSR